MLTMKQAAQYGYRSVHDRSIHDLPTPPSTTRASPPVTYTDSSQKPLPAIPRSATPGGRPMAAPHPRLPLPAGMALPHPATSVPQPPPAVSVPQGMPPGQPPPPQHAQPSPHSSGHAPALGPLPPPPHWQPGGEEAMRSWLAAKAEEERRKAEEERTEQEKLKVKQRSIELDMLRTSLSGGIPPVMVPVVFAGIGGSLSAQQVFEWAQHVMAQLQQAQPAQLPPPPQSAISPDQQRRGSQSQGYQYPGSAGMPSTPGSAQGPPPSFSSSYPASPTARPRGNTLPGSIGRPSLGGSGSTLPNIQTGSGALPPHMQQQQQQPASAQSAHPDAQQSPSIYFHHWQPPPATGQGSGTSQLSAPAGL